MIAPLIVLAMRHDLRLQRVSGVGCTAALVVLSGALLWAASVGAPQVYFLGDWPAPFGIVLVLDRLAAMMLALTAVLVMMALGAYLHGGDDRVDMDGDGQ